MSRYFFYIDSDRPHLDESGEELPDDAAAWRQGMRMARDIEDSLEPGQSWKLEIRTGERPVYQVTITTKRFS
jgi:hypothetical protein